MSERVCRHFNTLANAQCAKGIAYKDFGATITLEFWNSLPCLTAKHSQRCAHYTTFTGQELAAQEAFFEEERRQVESLSNRETTACIHCGETVTRITQVGRCCYARPCGCRLWQGVIPEVWR